MSDSEQPEHPSKNWYFQTRPVLMPEVGAEYLQETMQSLYNKKEFWDKAGLKAVAGLVGTFVVGAASAVFAPIAS